VYRRYTARLSRYTEGLATMEKTLGPDHPYVASELNNLAKLHREQGGDAEAEALRRPAPSIERRPSR
jgi:hypothetical protein